MAVVQRNLVKLLLAEQVVCQAQLKDRYHDPALNTLGQTSAAAVTGGAVVGLSEKVIKRLADLNAQMAIGLELLADA